jgi:hypothetical protein
MAAQQDDLVRVHVGNGHKTSAGTGPGTFELPRAETEALLLSPHARTTGPAGEPDRDGMQRR